MQNNTTDVIIDEIIQALLSLTANATAFDKKHTQTGMKSANRIKRKCFMIDIFIY